MPHLEDGDTFRYRVDRFTPNCAAISQDGNNETAFTTDRDLARETEDLIDALPSKLFSLLSRTQVSLTSRAGAKIPVERQGEGTQSLAVLLLFDAFLRSQLSDLDLSVSVNFDGNFIMKNDGFADKRFLIKAKRLRRRYASLDKETLICGCLIARK